MKWLTRKLVSSLTSVANWSAWDPKRQVPIPLSSKIRPLMLSMHFSLGEEQIFLKMKTAVSSNGASCVWNHTEMHWFFMVWNYVVLICHRFLLYKNNEHAPVSVRFSKNKQFQFQMAQGPVCLWRHPNHPCAMPSKSMIAFPFSSCLQFLAVLQSFHMADTLSAALPDTLLLFGAPSHFRKLPSSTLLVNTLHFPALCEKRVLRRQVSRHCTGPLEPMVE